MPPPLTPQTIRQNIRRQRRALNAQQQAHAAEMFAYYFCRSDYYTNAKRIACYLSNDGELSTELVIQRAWKDHKLIYLPVLHPFADRLQFAAYQKKTALVDNRFGIGEPALGAIHRVRALEMDVVLTPLVAFDRQGNRMGMGGGFYDRSFAFLKHRQHWRRPVLIGCAHSLQEVDSIPVQSWDVPLSAVFTDNGLISQE